TIGPRGDGGCRGSIARDGRAGRPERANGEEEKANGQQHQARPEARTRTTREENRPSEMKNHTEYDRAQIDQRGTRNPEVRGLRRGASVLLIRSRISRPASFLRPPHGWRRQAAVVRDVWRPERRAALAGPSGGFLLRHAARRYHGPTGAGWEYVICIRRRAFDLRGLHRSWVCRWR